MLGLVGSSKEKSAKSLTSLPCTGEKLLASPGFIVGDVPLPIGPLGSLAMLD